MRTYITDIHTLHACGVTAYMCTPALSFVYTHIIQLVCDSVFILIGSLSTHLFLVFSLHCTFVKFLPKYLI